MTAAPIAGGDPASAAAPGGGPRTARRLTTRGAVHGILWVQVVLALLLVSGDALRVLPGLLSPSAAPPVSDPVSPGDQTRRFRPGDLPERRPGLPFAVPDAMPSRLDFQADGATLRLTGEIAPGDGARFATHLEGLSVPPERIAFLSPGGSVMDAIEIGRAIREAGLPTAMEDGAICFSACPYMLAGGVERQVHRGAQVGVHQHYFGENVALPAFIAIDDVQRGQAEVMAHLDAMGVSPLLMRPAMSTPPDEIYVLVPEELSDFALATELVPPDE
ncbi:MAG: hypothetical protein MUE98_07320 [Rhodobacteraceae bacterium]|jgi:hypothetical protein|nr:hypothetical protein [Paracoccaceae bacterium]